MHLRCSDLPVYMLLRFKTSGAQYICRACVLGEGNAESLKSEQQGIEALLELEEQVIKAAAEADESFHDAKNEKTIEDAAKECNRSALEGQTVEHTKQNSSSTEKENTDQVNSSPSVCKFYMQKSCKHGRKGDDCKYSHPKLCFNYIKHGDKRGGCKKGSQCKFAHPKLCQRALETRTCSNKRCRFYHVAGTKFEIRDYPNVPIPSENSSPPTYQAPSYKEVMQRPKPQTAELRTNNANERNVVTLQENDQNFLEMKQQIKALQDQMQLLLTLMKPQAQVYSPTAPGMGWITKN